MELFTTLDMFSDKPLLEKVYRDIPVKLDEGETSLANHTVQSAIDAFGIKIVRESISEFTKVAITKETLIRRLQQCNLLEDALNKLRSSTNSVFNVELFNSTQIFYSNDRVLRIFLKRLGGKLEILLAPEV